MVAFLGHFYGSFPGDILNKYDTEEIANWYDEGVKLHNEINGKDG